LNEAIATKTSISFQARMIRPDGEVRLVQSKAGCELDEHGEVIALIGLFQDVTDQVRNLENLTASEARYRLLAENTSDVIVRCAWTVRCSTCRPPVGRWATSPRT
jgi:PAS domain-containing protein